ALSCGDRRTLMRRTCSDALLTAESPATRGIPTIMRRYSTAAQEAKGKGEPLPHYRSRAYRAVRPRATPRTIFFLAGNGLASRPDVHGAGVRVQSSEFRVQGSG